jgi:hypothetical protein
VGAVAEFGETAHKPAFGAVQHFYPLLDVADVRDCQRQESRPDGSRRRGEGGAELAADLTPARLHFTVPAILAE